MSLQDVLAAARGGAKGAAPAAGASDQAAPAKPAAPSAPSAPTVAKAAPSSAPAKLDPKKMSVADMLAAARGGAKSESPAPAAAPKSVPEAKPAAPKSDAPKICAAKLDPKKMSVADMLTAARGGAKSESPAPAAAAPKSVPEAKPAAPKSDAPKSALAKLDPRKCRSPICWPPCAEKQPARHPRPDRSMNLSLKSQRNRNRKWLSRKWHPSPNPRPRRPNRLLRRPKVPKNSAPPKSQRRPRIFSPTVGSLTSSNCSDVKPDPIPITWTAC